MSRELVNAALIGVVASVVLSCTPTAQPPGGGGVATNCTFPLGQSAGELAMACAITGTPANVLIDALNPSNASCAPASFTLFNQALTANSTFVWGQGGDDSDARVRIGVDIPDGASHTGTLAKSVGLECQSTIPPEVAVATSFGGSHVALVDKSRSPMCVFSSALNLTSFTQSINAGLTMDVSAATREGTEGSIARQIDLQAARAVNRLINPGADLDDDDFVGNAGRCPGDYVPFTGG